ncbi:MAG: thiamine pyrophosphate-binding protein [Acidobacteria bacterium]|nr:thiamine pyrophosphate-binding protein [Acidobacteriota bacterium]
MRHLLQQYYDGRISRRTFVRRLVATGLTTGAARSVVAAAEVGEEPRPGDPQRTRTITGTGGDLLVEQIKATGTKYVFTNPGSYEVGFFDALTDRPELQVILGLHEGVVLPMADGYHRVTQQPAFVNVHAVVGTAQLAGQLYNAHWDGSAIIVTAGLQDTARFSDDVVLGPRPGFTQAEINRQFTKISWEVRSGPSIPVSIRRAFKVAAAAPRGPVYVCYASAALEASNLTAEIWDRDSFLVDVRPRPPKDQVDALARLLLEAERPLPVFGDEIWKSGAQAEAVALCESLGLMATTHRRQAYRNFPAPHALYAGTFDSRSVYPNGDADLVIQIGTRDPGVMDLDAPILPRTARFVAVGIDTAMLGRTQRLDLAVVGDVGETLRDLKDAIASMATPARLQRLRDERLAIVRPHLEKKAAARRDAVKKNFDLSPIHRDRLGYELDRIADPDAIIVSENLTGSNDLIRTGCQPDERWWLMNVGSGLGWGVGAAVGAKLGAPDRQVILSIGDGAVMYSASGFWSMARYGVPVLTVVWNNLDYQTVRTAYHEYGRRMKDTGHYHGLYLGDPDIDFVRLAQSQGVGGEKVAAAGDLEAALKRGVQATRDGKPYLIDVVIARAGAGAESTWYQKFNLASQRTRHA